MSSGSEVLLTLTLGSRGPSREALSPSPLPQPGRWPPAPVQAFLEGGVVYGDREAADGAPVGHLAGPVSTARGEGE